MSTPSEKTPITPKETCDGGRCAVAEGSADAPESQMDDCNVICPYCRESYQAEAEDYSEREREETCEACGKTYTLWQEFEVTHHTQPSLNNSDQP